MPISVLHNRLLLLNQGLGSLSGIFCRQIECLLLLFYPGGVVPSLILP